MAMTTERRVSENWPELPWQAWEPTASTLHMWTQIVGKTRLALTPLQNHWWNVPLYVSARGLTTSAMFYKGELLDIEFDFVSHDLHFRLSSGANVSVPLRRQTVADFYQEFQSCLGALGVSVEIHPTPVEIPGPIPFLEDRTHASYDPDYAQRFWRVLSNTDRLFKVFSSHFLGKISPVHFFWGSFDLAVTRFSGRRAPPRPQADLITREAYSHEVISAGFWPGNGGFGAPAFYCYAAPSPAALDQEAIQPRAGYFDPKLGEFLLKYDDVRVAASPEDAVLEFLQSTYEAGANLAKWDRGALERDPASDPTLPKPKGR
jgi:Family of unknown function (DUF5996)